MGRGIWALSQLWWVVVQGFDLSGNTLMGWRRSQMSWAVVESAGAMVRRGCSGSSERVPHHSCSRRSQELGRFKFEAAGEEAGFKLKAHVLHLTWCSRWRSASTGAGRQQHEQPTWSFVLQVTRTCVFECRMAAALACVSCSRESSSEGQRDGHCGARDVTEAVADMAAAKGGMCLVSKTRGWAAVLTWKHSYHRFSGLGMDTESQCLRA